MCSLTPVNGYIFPLKQICEVHFFSFCAVYFKNNTFPPKHHHCKSSRGCPLFWASFVLLLLSRLVVQTLGNVPVCVSQTDSTIIHIHVLFFSWMYILLEHSSHMSCDPQLFIFKSETLRSYLGVLLCSRVGRLVRFYPGLLGRIRICKSVKLGPLLLELPSSSDSG